MIISPSLLSKLTDQLLDNFSNELIYVLLHFQRN